MRKASVKRVAVATATLIGLSMSITGPPTVSASVEEAGEAAVSQDWPEYQPNHGGGLPAFAFDLGFPVDQANWDRGSIFVSELTGDGLMDYIFTAPGRVAAYDHDGAALWQYDDAAIRLGGADQIPGPQHPGAIAADIFWDGGSDVMFIVGPRPEDPTSYLVVLKGGGDSGRPTGVVFPLPRGHNGGTPIGLALANLRGQGDRDIIVQYSQTELRAIHLDNGPPDPVTIWHVWEPGAWQGLEHSGVRVADLNGDGRDEVLGPIVLNPNGTRANAWDLRRDHGVQVDRMDSLAVGDIQPGGPLEVALAEQNDIGNGQHRGHTDVVTPGVIAWRSERAPASIPPTGQCSHDTDPDKLAVGDFDVSQPGLEVFARSSCANHPWVFDSNGSLDSESEPTWSWTVGASNTPAGWYRGGPENHEGGVDVVTPIRWEASGPEFIAVKERGADPNAKAALLVATNGAFLQPYQGHSIVTLDYQPQRVHRMYVADVAGDYREEVIVVDSNHDCGASVCNGKIRIYWNSKPNPHPDAQPRKWEQQYYRRVKQNWDYYSPS